MLKKHKHEGYIPSPYYEKSESTICVVILFLFKLDSVYVIMNAIRCIRKQLLSLSCHQVDLSSMCYSSLTQTICASMGGTLNEMLGFYYHLLIEKKRCTHL